MAGTFTNLVYHVVFSTKNREPIVVSSIRERLYGYMGGIVRSKRGHLLSIGGTDDHVHLALKLKPVDALSKTIGEPRAREKTTSSFGRRCIDVAFIARRLRTAVCAPLAILATSRLDGLCATNLFLRGP